MAARRLFNTSCFSAYSRLAESILLLRCNRYVLFTSCVHTNSSNGGPDFQLTQTLSPAVRYLVDTNAVDVAQLKPSGPKNRLLKGDVLQYLSEMKSGSSVIKSTKPVQPVKPAVEKPSVSFTDIPLTSMRKTIAKRLTLSKTSIPYSYSVIECRMDNLLKLRREILEEHSVKVSVNDLIVKAVAASLQRVPDCNASWTGDSVQLLPNIDVSVAVATEGGLITPVIKGADTLLITEISSQIRSLAEKARAGKLQPDEYQGGSFCVSNLGMFGITEFTAIINPPQSGILAVGGVNSIPWALDEKEEDAVAKVMTATLSHDCRVIDYELASKWLTVFSNFIESPTILGLL